MWSLRLHTITRTVGPSLFATRGAVKCIDFNSGPDDYMPHLLTFIAYKILINQTTKEKTTERVQLLVKALPDRSA